jgi:hypothetical protein
MSVTTVDARKLHRGFGPARERMEWRTRFACQSVGTVQADIDPPAVGRSQSGGRDRQYRLQTSIGGVRMAPDVSTEEAFRLARAMTFKNAARLPHGGGKSVIFADPRCGCATRSG